MHNRKKADVSVLQGKSRFEENVLQSVGKTARVVRSAARLDSMAGGVAAGDHIPRTGYQLANRPRMNLFLQKNECCHVLPVLPIFIKPYRLWSRALALKTMRFYLNLIY